MDVNSWNHIDNFEKKRGWQHIFFKYYFAELWNNAKQTYNGEWWWWRCGNRSCLQYNINIFVFNLNHKVSHQPFLHKFIGAGVKKHVLFPLSLILNCLTCIFFLNWSLNSLFGHQYLSSLQIYALIYTHGVYI